MGNCYCVANTPSLPLQDHLISVSTHPQYIDISINRPQKNNTLTKDMAMKIQLAIRDLNNTPQTKVVFLRKQEGSAFCGGGDLEYIMKDQSIYNYQYEVNKFVFYFSQLKATTIAFMDGLTKGSGVGLSFFAKIKIATENTLLALPETRFGYITDVGAGYYLPRLKEGMGLFMMLTGTAIRGEDLVRTGLADYYVQSHQLEKVREEIIEHVKNNSEVNEGSIRKIIDKYSQKVIREYSLKTLIKQNFEGKKSIEEVLKSLGENKSDDSVKSILEVMKLHSPLGLKANFELFERGKKMKLEDDLKLEWNVGRKLRAHIDVKTAVQKAPLKQTFEWSHKSVEEVKNEELEELFKVGATPEF